MDKTDITDTPRYLVAKYVPDLSRMEPRNIGVIVWSKYGLRSRFLAEKEPGTAQLDKRSVPGFVTNASVYEQWVSYWTKAIQKPAIESISGGESVSVSQPQSLDVLKTTSSGNFILQGEGFLIDQVDLDDLDNLTNYLFSELVINAPADDTKDRTLQEMANEILQESGIIKSPNFASDVSISYEFGNIKHMTKFNHAYRNGQLSLIQRVPNIKMTNATDRAYATAFKFERVVESEIIDCAHGFSLVSVPPEQLDDNTKDRIDILEQVSTVFNLSDEKHQGQFLECLQKLCADE